MATEPCVTCGEETGVGSIYYSDRRQIARADGSSSYVCTLCVQRLARKGRRLSDEELGRAIDTDASAQLARWQQLNGDGITGGGL